MKQEKSQYFPDPNGKNTAENETLHFLNGLTPKKCVFLNTLYAFVLNVKKTALKTIKNMQMYEIKKFYRHWVMSHISRP